MQGAETGTTRKEAKPRSKSQASTEQDAVDTSQVAHSRRQSSAADAVASTPTKPKSTPKPARSSQQDAGSANLAQKDSKPAGKRSATAAKPAPKVSSKPSQQPLLAQSPATAQASSDNIAEASIPKPKSVAPAAAAPAPAPGIKGQTSKKVLNSNSRPIKGQDSTAQGLDSQSKGAEIAGPAADGKLTAKRRSRRRAQQPVTAEPATATLSLPSYQYMKQHVSEDRRELADEEEEAIRNHMLAFQGSANVQDQALSLYVNAEVSNQMSGLRFTHYHLAGCCIIVKCTHAVGKLLVPVVYCSCCLSKFTAWSVLDCMAHLQEWLHQAVVGITAKHCCRFHTCTAARKAKGLSEIAITLSATFDLCQSC